MVPGFAERSGAFGGSSLRLVRFLARVAVRGCRDHGGDCRGVGQPAPQSLPGSDQCGRRASAGGVRTDGASWRSQHRFADRVSKSVGTGCDRGGPLPP
ncbi:hypothetical protein WQQ_14100 [Hydrocarboniphaga effusa AP103]|uniref:Uncharacterized protein n=1 Tax=Hydrocarboniphaga effusa AP103 TaxID=1172194 RepID=I8TC96_9GAMM|nr:hypothetical protein WQQ_14100 [Hydrocarboniphaga effusa AP103]